MSLATLEEGAEYSMSGQVPVPVGVITTETKIAKIKEIANEKYEQRELDMVIHHALMDNTLYRRIANEEITIKQALEEIKKDPSFRSDDS